jgi:diguanylate cyclase
VRSVVEATISLAHALQVRVVAEGVETREQAEALAAMGCDEVQGYFYGRPVVADEFEGRARAGSHAG